MTFQTSGWRMLQDLYPLWACFVIKKTWSTRPNSEFLGRMGHPCENAGNSNGNRKITESHNHSKGNQDTPAGMVNDPPSSKVANEPSVGQEQHRSHRTNCARGSALHIRFKTLQQEKLYWRLVLGVFVSLGWCWLSFSYHPSSPSGQPAPFGKVSGSVTASPHLVKTITWSPLFRPSPRRRFEQVWQFLHRISTRIFVQFIAGAFFPLWISTPPCSF